VSARVGFDLLIVSDGQPCLPARVAQALAAAEPGRVAVLLREPQRRAAELLALAATLRALTLAHGALLLISDRVDVALAAQADGVQLPEAGFSPQVARALLGPAALIGVSRHDAAGLSSAARDGADYATLSPVHVVPEKAAPLGHAGFAHALRDARSHEGATSLPVYALGGVRAVDVSGLVQAGARGVAVMREVLAAADPAARLGGLLAALATARAAEAGAPLDPRAVPAQPAAHERTDD
jgi:thiamine-phosphate pyrophosphorylase